MAKNNDDLRDNHTIILDALVQYGGAQKTTHNSRFICCPLPTHGGVDKTPSMGIYLSEEGPIPLGYYHCLGCSAKGRWNALAEVAGFAQIKEWKSSDKVSDTILTPEIEDQLLGETGTTFKKVLQVMRCEEAQRWPKHLDWRGFDGELIYKVGGHIINDERNNNIGLVFPIKIKGKVRGGVKAVYEKKGKQLGYVNMKGDWTRNYGLFPYMYVQKLINEGEYDFVVLVEGPRDALRLCSLGIPALAILGATSMSDVKALLIVSLNVSTVYIISDNDNGGTVMYKNAKKFLTKTDSIKVRRIKLPTEYDDSGKLIKMDPGNAPIRIVKRIIDVFREAHNFIPPRKVSYASV